MAADACPSTPTERIVRGVIAVVLAAVAVTSYPTWLIVVPTGLMALALSVGALTGHCPDYYLTARRGAASATPNRFGITDASDLVDLTR